MVKSTRRYRRSEEQVFESLAWPSQGLSFYPEQSRRHLAIAEVLYCLPDEDFKHADKCFEEFIWFIPHEDVTGEVQPFPARAQPEPFNGVRLRHHAYVIYLAPQLEKAAWSIVVSTVAHELAHVVLGHKFFGYTEDEYQAQEEEAWQQIRDWGFEEEAARHLRLNRWRKSRERKMYNLEPSGAPRRKSMTHS
jgi:hypothetical protein